MRVAHLPAHDGRLPANLATLGHYFLLKLSSEPVHPLINPLDNQMTPIFRRLNSLF
jgi:hypothetical protein